MSALAYGWVEPCSDIASCGTNFLKDKYLLSILYRQWYFLLNDEHVECLNVLNEWILLPLYAKYLCICQCFISMHFIMMFMGLDFPG